MKGKVVLCENIAQYLESLLEDLDIGLGWGNASYGAMPAADNKSLCRFSGLSMMVAENMHMNSFLSLQTQMIQNNVNKIVNNTQQMFKAIGCPVENHTLKIPMGLTNKIGEEQHVFQNLPYVPDHTLSLHDQIANVQRNVALMTGAEQ